ncbi:type IX secretion system membrane protein, PorP/SprF family [Tenacibaculum sp. MAR_2009_124]|uniref:PorP/SprF family type IX secretion system membrane protein n=1 Tax=Tenacibaculum sp. MAR_2009_124 TaxID=1250059 RepID=UPI00089490A7|nr:type IX secretion system membrane protein PorP/SprF [Tenacibaculum sp. MAR_2009_124]SED15239.1 type IX secretion system membrane protein, PorP/SprF family [Tenacibaculum sp. MAR_2009_124]
MKINVTLLVLLVSFGLKVRAQETLPIYFDYLSDNVFLIHPAAAGVGECAKIRLTARQQWAGVRNAPELQTLSFHSKVGPDSKAAYGVVLFNDKNGFHSQKALQGTYAYHLLLGNENQFNQLSFGLSMSVVQNQVDQTNFFNDPTVSQVVESNLYFNADFGMAYHYGGFSSYLTIKNILLSAKGQLNEEFESLNLRNYVLGAGYFFGDEDKIQFEPSFMFQYKDQTGEKLVDLNMKVYKTLENSKAQLWGGISYRKGFDGSIFGDSNYVSPFVGVNYKRYMFGYTFTKQSGDVVFGDGNFHQLSFGMNVLCRKRRGSACPNINGRLF